MFRNAFCYLKVNSSFCRGVRSVVIQPLCCEVQSALTAVQSKYIHCDPVICGYSYIYTDPCVHTYTHTFHIYSQTLIYILWIYKLITMAIRCGISHKNTKIQKNTTKHTDTFEYVLINQHSLQQVTYYLTLSEYRLSLHDIPVSHLMMFSEKTVKEHMEWQSVPLPSSSLPVSGIFSPRNMPLVFGFTQYENSSTLCSIFVKVSSLFVFVLIELDVQITGQSQHLSDPECIVRCFTLIWSAHSFMYVLLYCRTTECNCTINLQLLPCCICTH